MVSHAYENIQCAKAYYSRATLSDIWCIHEYTIEHIKPVAQELRSSQMPVTQLAAVRLYTDALPKKVAAPALKDEALADSTGRNAIFIVGV